MSISVGQSGGEYPVAVSNLLADNERSKTTVSSGTVLIILPYFFASEKRGQSCSKVSSKKVGRRIHLREVLSTFCETFGKCWQGRKTLQRKVKSLQNMGKVIKFYLKIFE